MRPARVEQLVWVHSSVDHAPSLGVRPNMQTGFAPKVEETLGHCRKPHMGTSAFRARKAAHLRLTLVGPVPSVHSGMQTWYAGQVRIAISADTTRSFTTRLRWTQSRWRSLCDDPSGRSVGQVRRGRMAATSLFRAQGRQRNLVDRWLASRNCQNGTARQAGSGSVSIGGRARGLRHGSLGWAHDDNVYRSHAQMPIPFKARDATETTPSPLCSRR